MKLKFKWEYGENENQKYYDVTVNGDYLCVFENKWQPNIWLGTCKDKTILDKTSNDRERKREELPLGCAFNMLRKITLLSSEDPEYMKRKVEWCYLHNKFEISK